MVKEYILGVDIGTTATKVALFDLEGNTVANATKEYELVTPTALEVEVDVETLWNAFKEGVGAVLSTSKVEPSSVKALGISAQGETLVPIDKKGKPLRRAIAWLDCRAQEEADVLDKNFDDGKSYKITGQVKLVPTWPASKILWIKKNEPYVFQQVYKYLLVEDYFIWKMTGAFVAEGSLLCSTCYWNIVTKKWWNEMLDFLGITPEQLPEIREPGEKIGNLISSAAQELGLSTETIVSTGALDQACGTIGVGNIKPGIFTENIGAALAICATLERPVFDPKGRMPIHYHAIPDTYMAHTFTTGGMVLRWFRDSFCETEMNVANLANISPYQLIDKEVSQIRPGAEGLAMLPHLQGAMAPEANPKAKGVFFGFTLRHKRPHFARSIMEAVACIIRRNIDVLEDMRIKVTEIRALGGGTRSKIWNQIIADLTKRPVITTLHDEDAACLGAAILAGKTAGLFGKLEGAVKEMVKIKERFEPNPKNFEVYDDLYIEYVKLYESLKEIFETT
jgi:sugar (pentulose or hexulose) kinase